ncbi:MAG: hypothetical protein IKK10_03355 [Clostridia bacterium]|nr:hypothetical protein [Clostridia bacterium]
MRGTRRFICLVLAIFCLVFTALSVSAQGNTHYIEELQMSIDIPDYMAVATRTNKPTMKDGIYLEASSSAPDLDIRVLMSQDEKTKEFFNLSLLSSSALDEYKNAILANPEYSDCTEGEYGGVLFLDFTTYDTVGDITVYGRQSVTIVNGMSIVIMSTSQGDALSSEEISLIREVVSSVKFDKILSNAPKIGFWKVFLPILIVLVVLVLGFFVFSYFMSKKSKEAKRRRQKELERKRNYDVLSRAESKARNPENLGGYKTSDAFFEDAFSSDGAKTANSADTTDSSARNTANSVVKGSKQAVKSTGYFFTNLKRELKKSKKNKKNSKKTVKPQDRKPRDYDVFSD